MLYILIVYYIFVNKITRWTGFQTFHQLRLHTGFSFSNGFFGGFFGSFFDTKFTLNTCLSCFVEHSLSKMDMSSWVLLKLDKLSLISLRTSQ